MHSVHLIGSPTGETFIGKGAADEAVVRARLEAAVRWTIILGTPRPTQAAAVADLVEAHCALHELAGFRATEGWYPVRAEHAARIIADAWKPGERDIADGRRCVEALMNLTGFDAETVAVIIGVSAATVSRIRRGVGMPIDHYQFERLRIVATRMGLREDWETLTRTRTLARPTPGPRLTIVGQE